MDRLYLCVMPESVARWLTGPRGPLNGYLPWPRSQVQAEHRGNGAVVLNYPALQSLRVAEGDGRVAEDGDGALVVTFGTSFYRVRELTPAADRMSA